MVQNQSEIKEKHYQITITILAFHVQAQPKSNNFSKDFILFVMKTNRKLAKKAIIPPYFSLIQQDLPQAECRKPASQALKPSTGT